MPPYISLAMKTPAEQQKSGEGERFITTINLSLSKEMINYHIDFLDYLRVHRNPMLAAVAFHLFQALAL